MSDKRTKNFFSSPATVWLRITIKLCMQIEYVHTIFAPGIFFTSSNFSTMGLRKIEGICSNASFCIYLTFIIGNVSNLKHLYIGKPCINHINFIKIEQGSYPARRQSLKISRFLVFIGLEMSNYGPTNVKFGTACRGLSSVFYAVPNFI